MTTTITTGRTTTRSHKLCVRTRSGLMDVVMRDRVINKIRELDPGSVVDNDRNPVTFWIRTKLSVETIRSLEYVCDAIVSKDQSS